MCLIQRSAAPEKGSQDIGPSPTKAWSQNTWGKKVGDALSINVCFICVCMCVRVSMYVSQETFTPTALIKGPFFRLLKICQYDHYQYDPRSFCVFPLSLLTFPSPPLFFSLICCQLSTNPALIMLLLYRKSFSERKSIRNNKVYRCVEFILKLEGEMKAQNILSVRRVVVKRNGRARILET